MLRWLYYKIHPRTIEDLSPTTQATRLEAKSALESAEKDLQSTLERGDLAYKLAEGLRHEYEKNHLAELVEMTMRGTG